ncbi:MAG: thioredoxin [Gemmatimonadota bacterium]|nr:MAG: thioredoxin [Gemmatimonadota bacterium]
MTDKAEARSRKVTVPCQFCLSLNRVDLSRADERPKCGECGKPILLDRPVRVNDDDFRRVIEGADVPVVVDFHADWCGPCKIMAPLLDDFAYAHKGEVLVAKLDTDRSPQTPQQFGIRGIPTLIIFKNGQEAGRRTGVVSGEELEALLASA